MDGICLTTEWLSLQDMSHLDLLYFFNPWRLPVYIRFSLIICRCLSSSPFTFLILFFLYYSFLSLPSLCSLFQFTSAVHLAHLSWSLRSYASNTIYCYQIFLPAVSHCGSDVQRREDLFLTCRCSSAVTGKIPLENRRAL